MSDESNTKPRRVDAPWPIRLLSSYGLACGVLFFMTLATLLGTLAQKDLGLHKAQKMYFESWFYVHQFILPGGYPLSMAFPGGMLLMGLLGANLLIGGLLRLKRKPQNIGLFITHSSILVLLAGGLVEHLYKFDGNMPLREGETSDYFQSSYDRIIELETLDVPRREAFVIPDTKFATATKENPAVFEFPNLPVRLVVHEYIVNSVPRQVTAPQGVTSAVVDGYTLESLEVDKNYEMNLEGAVIALESKSGEKAQALVWGGTRDSAVLTVDGIDYAVRISRRKFKLPFAITEKEFIREVYPGTQTPKRFSSFVSVAHDDGRTEDREITMNFPLRSKGYAVFQSSFDERSPQALSVFQIAKNPSDHWPIVGFSLVFVGLLIHFVMKLLRFLKGPREKTTTLVS